MKKSMDKDKSISFELARQFLGKEVDIVIDRPIGGKHPKYGFVYEVNYGYLPGVRAPDGEELGAYYLGSDQPLNKANGVVIAIIHRTEDDDDKLVVMPKGADLTNGEIEKKTNFQEKWFRHVIIRK